MDMGKILVIDDDRNIQSLIEKIFPKEGLRVIKASSQDMETLGNSEISVLKSPSPASMEDAVRAFLREEVNKSSWGSIHEKVIGKIERALIRMILEEEKGNQVRVSKRLGINRNTLRKKMKDLQITTRVVTGV
jgi:DNA-binding NtrC family response regulator